MANRYRFSYCLAYCLLGATISFGESSSTLLHAVAPSVHSIIDGYQANPDFELTKHTVMLSTPKRDSTKSETELCTGTMLGGCILTAAHCIDVGDETFVYSGERPNLERPLDRTFERRIKGKGGTADDIAIIKPSKHLPVASFGKEVLADKPLDNDVGRVTIMGYGVAGTKEVESEDPATPPEKVDYGGGRRRVGVSWMKGYGTMDPKTTKINYSDSKTGDELIVSRTTPEGELLNIAGGGDSGGPLYYQGKIYGTAIAGLMKNPEMFVAPKAVHTNTAVYTSMVKQRKWILDTMDELGCTDKVDPTNELLALTKEHLYSFQGTYSSATWNTVEQEVVDGVKIQLRSLLGLGDHKTLLVRPSVKLGDIDSFVFKVTVAEGSSDKTYLVELTKDGKVKLPADLPPQKGN